MHWPTSAAWEKDVQQDSQEVQFAGRHSWAVQAGADKILAAEDMRDYAIFALDEAGRVASWNSGAERMKGYRSEEIVGRHFSIFYPRDRVEIGYPEWELEQATASGFFIDRGWRLRKDGSRFWAHVVITAQRTPGGDLHGYIKVVRDESAALARHQRTQRQYSDLFELAPAGIALLDDNGRFLEANGALCDLLGRRREEVVGLRDREVLHPEDRGGPIASFEEGPAPHRVLTGPSGEAVHCQLRVADSVRDDGSRSWLVIANDITGEIQRAEALRLQAMHDDLTGLLNRRGFEEHLVDALGGDTNAALLYCDLDNFKRINDALGHEAGDELLVAVAERLRTGLPSECTSARLYGDEFAVLCSDLDAIGGIEELEGEVAHLCRTTVPLRGRQVLLSATVGSVALEPDLNSADLLGMAERAMRSNRMSAERTRGGGRPAHPGADQLTLEEDVRAAIESDQLQLHYQPIIGAGGRVLLGEALLRWQHPELGPITPDVLLDVAERGGLLVDLDRWVLRTALREAADWCDPDGEAVGVAVNLAGLGPEQSDFVDTVGDSARTAGISPHLVVLEMVETVLAEMGPESLGAMRTLVGTGVRFAIDDFGTGYSSFARLRELPAQIVKLDRSFVSGIGEDPADLGIVRTMNELARTLGLYCIAEGVENGTQQHLLRSIGVDVYQGYHFAPALAPDKFRAFLAGQ
jgi:diguanylate cyclase (GGDEF)-like protein/PAS domain S-box-containing protein